MSKADAAIYQPLTVWAAACAAQVLASFEDSHPEDSRPRQAIEAARLWARGEMKMSAARTVAFAAHAAACDAHNAVAQAAARAAGHAAATAHVPSHAKYAASYALKAAADAHAEREWQLRDAPEDFKKLL